MNDFPGGVYLQWTELFDSFKVLLIERSQTSAVEMLVENPVSLTQVDVVDHVTTHEVGVCEFGRVSFKSGRES